MTPLHPPGQLDEPASPDALAGAAFSRGSGYRPTRKFVWLRAASAPLGLLSLGSIIIIIKNNVTVTINTGGDKSKATIRQEAGDGIGVSVTQVAPADTPGQPVELPAAMPPAPDSNPPSHPEPSKHESVSAPVSQQPSPGKGTATKFTNTIGMKFVLIPPGEFMMGSPDANAPPEELPEHKVRISTSFFLGVTEVTQAQYEPVIGHKPSFFSLTGEGKDIIAGQPTGEYPVEQVSWLDAIAVCNALSKKEGLAPYYLINGDDVRIPDRKAPGYRLPTEVEWDYACRAGKSGKFPPGDPMIEYGWFRANSNGSTHPVGQKRPNEFGLFDMHANVFEWCYDGFAFYFYQRSPVEDPSGPDGMSTRVARGSGWRSPQRKTWWTRFEGRDPHQRHFVVGFRVARTQPPIPISDKSPAPTAAAGPSAEYPVDRASSAGLVKTPTIGQALGAKANQPPATPLVKGSREEKLSTLGFSRAGAYFVIPSEAEILEKFDKVRPMIASMAQPFNMFAQAGLNDVLLAEAEEYFNEMKARVDVANTILSKVPNGARSNSADKLAYQQAQDDVSELTQERDNASRLIEARRAQQIPAGRKEELVKDFNAKWSEFLKAADQLTPLFEKAFGQYRILQDDPVVKDALAAFARSTKTTALLGPSKNLQNDRDAIKNARRTYAPETAAPRKKSRPANASPTAAQKKKGQSAKH